jgi:hypothetical protein
MIILLKSGPGVFAQQPAIFKLFQQVDDRVIPGTLNVGNTLPTICQAFIFMTTDSVDFKRFHGARFIVCR